MDRVAIVGGTSALAEQLIPFLQDTNEVITLGRSGCEIYCDLLDNLEAIRIPEGTEAVVHVAAAFEGSTDSEILRTIETNLSGTIKVCMAAKKAATRHLVIISSLFAQLTEDSPYYGIYSITKRQAEELAANYCRRNGILLTILRPSQLVGEGDAFRRHQPLFYLMADCAQKGQDIPLYGKNDALRNYLHAGDMSRIICRVLEVGFGGLYSCAFPRNVALSEVASAALAAFGCGGRFVFVQDEPDIPHNVFDLSNTLYEKIGFFPDVDVWEGMRRVARHRRAENS